TLDCEIILQWGPVIGRTGIENQNLVDERAMLKEIAQCRLDNERNRSVGYMPLKFSKKRRRQHHVANFVQAHDQDFPNLCKVDWPRGHGSETSAVFPSPEECEAHGSQLAREKS